MPPNRAFFSPFPPMSRPRLRANGTFKTEEKVEKRTFLSEGYANQAKDREVLHRRYHKIGISAVAAAVRYQGNATTEQVRNDDRIETESAA
jgi:uncharacterized Zn finger protein